MIPVLWLCGPSGVGKTTVAWALYTQFAQAAVEPGFVDIDQLGMCYPEPPDDPGRYRMAARNLAAVTANFEAAGARCVVVSGVVDPLRGVPADLIPQAALTVCRLRADSDVVRERFVGRGGDPTLIGDVLADADTLDRGDVTCACVVDTTGLPVSDVIRLVRAGIGDWPGPVPRRSAASDEAVTSPDGPVLWLCGATGVGKSTVGFEVYQRALRAGRTAAYVDLDQLGSCPVPLDDPAHHRVKARNLAALWGTYRTAGAEWLIVTGQVADDASIRIYTDAMPSASVTLCRLHAGPEELTRRIMRRGNGGGSWNQPGDPLLGRSASVLHRIAESAAASAIRLDCAGIGALRIDTDGRAMRQIADEILSLG